MPAPVLGLRANWRQIALLVVLNGFVGATVGLERTVLPVLAEREFRVASNAAILSFLVGFGLVKAFANLAAGSLSDGTAGSASSSSGGSSASPSGR